MFEQTNFNHPLDKWSVSRVRSMESMFAENVAFNQDLSAWNVASVTNMAGMFYRSAEFSQNLCPWVDVLPNNTNLDFAFWATQCPSQAMPEFLATGPLCFACANVPPTSVWEIGGLGDECVRDGACIQSHPSPGATTYTEDDQTCAFLTTASGTLIVEIFDTEPGKDVVRVNGQGYSGDGTGLNETRVAAGTRVEWESSEDDVVGYGWRICLQVDN